MMMMRNEDTLVLSAGLSLIVSWLLMSVAVVSTNKKVKQNTKLFRTSSGDVTE